MASTVNHSIKDVGFSYDVLHAQMKKGSIISKNIHPIKEVEELKNKLKSKHLLKDVGAFFILTKPIYTGLLMARNLNLGYLIKENDLKQDIYISHDEATQLQELLPKGNIIRSDADIIKNTDKHCYKICNVYKITVNHSFLQNHSSDGFGADEKFVYDILKAKGIISSSARHGYAQKNEADIVDEVNHTQYEVIYESKIEPVKKKDKAKVLFDPDIQTVRLISDNQFINISDALINKFTKKQYSTDFKTCLVILNIGSQQTTSDLLQKIADSSIGQMGRLPFADIFVISYDFLTEVTSTCQISNCSFDEQIYDGISFDFVQKEKVNYSSMQMGSKYLIECKNIFNKRGMLFHAETSEIKQLVKQMHIYI